MLHSIIIDDEPRAVRGLEILLTKYVSGVRLVATATDPYKGVELINNYRPDVVFLDINMPSLDGFAMLDKVEYTGFAIVFCTAHREYGLKALRANAVDYLLKPVSLEELTATLERVRKKLAASSVPAEVFDELKKAAETRNVRVPLQTKTNIDYLSPEEIAFIEASSHQSIVTLASGTACKVNQGLKEYETLLCPEGSPFIRIQLSYIINVNHITRYIKDDGGYVVMQNGKRIPVSKSKKAELFRRLNLIA